MANHYGISSREEAQEYIQHPILRPRLRECTRLVILVEGRSIVDILGYTDHLKFRSSMTLFAHVTPGNDVFMEALNKYFDGQFDRLTLELLEP